MNTLSCICWLQVQLMVNIVFAQVQYPVYQHHVFPHFRRSAARMIPKPEEYLTDLRVIPLEAVKMQMSQLQQQQQEDPGIDKFLARGISKITLDINRVAPTSSPYLARADNIVYGPVTIAVALALLLLGSLGQTFNEIANFMGLGNTGLNIYNNPGLVQEEFGRLLGTLETTAGIEIGQMVTFATGIFIEQNHVVRPEYRQTSSDFYKTDIISLDFQGNPQMAHKVINDWVSQRTNDKIPSLLMDPPPPHTKAIIASVLYFKAPWEYPFFDGHTKLRPFYTNGRKNPTNKMVQMMVNGGEFPYHKDTALGVEIMGFPYKGGRTAMYVVLPMDSNVEKLKHVENMMTAADIERLVASTKITEAVVVFPKMRLENTLDLSATLQTLGVSSLFNPYEANLGLLTSGVTQNHMPPDAPFVSDISSRLRPAAAPLPPPPPPYRPPQQDDDNDRLIFTRFGDLGNCQVWRDPISNVTKCVPIQQVSGGPTPIQSLEHLRQVLTANSGSNNPGLYADQVIHKVFIDITESGTEAAAATGVSLNRSGGRVTFRVDMPFLFFIYHEGAKTILFYGSVKTPTPSVTTS